MIPQSVMVRRILRHYRAADMATRRAGAEWYPNAFALAVDMCPAQPKRVAGVIAALSPRVWWSVNVEWSRAIIAAADTGQECPPVHFPVMRSKAWRIANGADPLSVLNGPKETPFYRNITGDTQSVTVDIWAVRSVMPDHSERLPVRTLRAIASAYQRAAVIANISPATLQATVWIHVRGNAS